MKNILISIVFAILIATGSLLLIVGNDGTNNENRTAATMPELDFYNVFSGKYALSADAYINDRIKFRNEMINLSRKIDSYKGITSLDGKVIRTKTDLGTGTKQASDILVVNNTIMEMFNEKKDVANLYIEAVNQYAKKLDKNTNLYLMLSPTQLEFQDDMYANIQDSQKDAIDYIYENTDSRFKKINVYDTLYQHKDEYIYFRTDHHWTMLGAYYAYKAFAAQTKQISFDLDDFPEHETDSFLGYLYAFAPSEQIKKKPDTIKWYDVNINNNISCNMTTFKKDGTASDYDGKVFDKSKKDYSFFLGADHPLACYTNSTAPNNKTIMIIADSYVNVLAPWLMNNYKTVVLINPRSHYRKLEATIRQYKPDDIMIMNYVFSTSFKDYCKILKNLL